jgi:hypothetical protein
LHIPPARAPGTGLAALDRGQPNGHCGCMGVQSFESGADLRGRS